VALLIECGWVPQTSHSSSFHLAPLESRKHTVEEASTRIVPELTTLISLQALIFTSRYGSHYEDLKVL